ERVLGVAFEIKDAIDDRFVWGIVGPRRQRSEDAGRAVPLPRRQAQRLPVGQGAIFPARRGFGGRREMEPGLVVLVDSQAVGAVALEGVPAGEVEEVLDRRLRLADPL